MRAGKNKKVVRGNTIMYIACILLFLTMVSMHFTSGLYARYSTTIEKADVARVAVMAADVTFTVSDDIPIAPGEVTKIPIVVANYQGSAVCEVAQKYLISVRMLEDNLPLKWQLYEDESCSIESNGEGTFVQSVKESKEYWLKVSWPAEENSASYAFEVDAVEITVSVEQID